MLAGLMAVAALLGVCLASSSAGDDDGANVQHHWVFQTSAAVPYVHMGTIVALPNNTLGVAFQESSLGVSCNDQSIFFTTSLDGGATWQPHVLAASAPQGPFACWGPVLHFDQDSAVLWLFFSISGPQQNSSSSGCGSFGGSYPGGAVYYATSQDLGATWSGPTEILSFESLGQISKMTANLLFVTQNGSWILPVWGEAHSSYDLVPDFAGVLISLDKGQTWNPYGRIMNNDTWLIENTIAQASNGSLFQVFRTTVGVLYVSFSNDGGFTWLEAVPTTFPNPNSKICMVNVVDNDFVVLASNPSSTSRNPLTLSYSYDGLTWTEFALLADNSSIAESYPTPMVLGSQVFTVYSDPPFNPGGIMLAIADLPAFPST